MLVVIAGEHGSGSSSVSSRLRELIADSTVVDGGIYWREHLDDLKDVTITVDDDKRFDNLILAELKQKMKRWNVVIFCSSSRGVISAKKWFPNEQKITVFLKCDLPTRMERKGSDLIEREKAEREFNERRFGISNLSFVQQQEADIVIDTGKFSVETVVKMIVEAVISGGNKR